MVVLVRQAIAGQIYCNTAVVLFQFINVLLPHGSIISKAMYEEYRFFTGALVYVCYFAITGKVYEMRLVWVCDQCENLRMCSR